MPTAAETEQVRIATHKLKPGVGALLIDLVLMPVTVMAQRTRAQSEDSYARRHPS
jgi:hypothetical protein